MLKRLILKKNSPQTINSIIILSVLFFFAFGETYSQEDAAKSIEYLLSIGKVEKAKAEIHKKDDKFKNSPKGVELMGDIYGRLKMWDSAMASFEKLKILAPNNAAGFFKYGGALGMKALTKNKMSALLDLDEIEAHFIKATQIDSKYIAAYWALIEFYFKVPSVAGGGTKKAKIQANKLFKISPIEGLMALARVAEEKNKLPEAEELYKKANNKGGSLLTHQALISFYERHEKWDQSFEVLTDALNSFDQISLCYQWAKISVLSHQQIQRGLSCIEKCVAKSDDLINIPLKWLLLRQAQLLMLNGQNNLALIKIERALDQDSDFKEAKDEKTRLMKLLN